MKKYLIIAFLMLSSLGFAVAQNVATESNNQKVSEKSSIPVVYTCPMHPEITSTKPGNCSICGMKLQKAKAENNPCKWKVVACPVTLCNFG